MYSNCRPTLVIRNCARFAGEEVTMGDFNPEHVANERASAFAWLMEDPDHRAIESPTHLDAVLNLYAARAKYPDAIIDVDHFPCCGESTCRVTRALRLHLYTF